MADITITPANVIAAAGASLASGIAGATITAGKIVHASPANGRMILSDADAAGIGLVTKFYIALNGASDGQPVALAAAGDIALGVSMTAGTSYYLSPVAGGIAPRADVLTGDNVIFLGTARSTSVLAFSPLISGVTL
jgi:hypothetical protein